MKRRRFVSLIIIGVLVCTIFAGCGTSKMEQVYVTEETSNIDEKEPEKIKENKNTENDEEDIQKSLLNKLGRGINIGNCLDCYDEWNENAVITETYWGNPEITEDYVKTLVDSGFATIRIPVTWAPHIVNGKVDEAFMNRVKEVVDYAYNSGAYVILDVHHDKKFAPSYGNYNFAKEYLENLWLQVAEEFKDYDDRLIFEGINEPRFYGQPDEWTDGTPEGADNTNKLMDDFVCAVRSTGGNNASRLLLITCYCNRSGGVALNRLIIPEDENLAVSVHSYDPYEFTSSGGYRLFDDELKKQFDYTVNSLKEFKRNHNIPVIVTEWGAYESVGKEGRIEYIKYVENALDEVEIPCVWWDNGSGYGNGAYGLFDRNSCTPYDQEIVDAILKEN